MKTCIDCADILTRGDLHDALTRALSLPQWYGRNMDALYDCLTDLHADTELVLLHPEALDEPLGSYASVFAAVLREACEENPHLTVSYGECTC